MNIDKSKFNISWHPNPSNSQWLDLEEYLNLKFTSDTAKKLYSKFEDKVKDHKSKTFQAKDILRAANMLNEKGILPADDKIVQKELKLFKNGKSIAPIMLVKQHPNQKLLIVDGFHRLCAIYHIDPEMHCLAYIIKD